ncbi:MAG: hypothetical protein M3O36_04460 [Myxococcota bacterium]|nr:hypothetical protein [Myxococcota bacterium]
MMKTGDQFVEEVYFAFAIGEVPGEGVLTSRIIGEQKRGDLSLTVLPVNREKSGALLAGVLSSDAELVKLHKDQPPAEELRVPKLGKEGRQGVLSVRFPTSSFARRLVHVRMTVTPPPGGAPYCLGEFFVDLSNDPCHPIGR